MKASQKQFLESEMQRDGEVFKQCHFYRRVGFDNEADFYITKTDITLYKESKEAEILFCGKGINANIRKVNITSGINNVGGGNSLLSHFAILR